MRALFVVALLAATASAAPKGAKARKEFDRGVAAYAKGDYQAASVAFEKSNALETDAETLFAWAQAERKLDLCETAISLYTKLLAMDLPAENKEAINVQIGECKDILAARKPAEPAKPEPAKPEPVVDSQPIQPPADSQPEPAPAPEGHAWWKDPVGGGLVGAGVIGVGMGIVFLVRGHAADQDKLHATSYQDFQTLDNQAKSNGTIGVVSLVIGGALAGGGVYWYATQTHANDKTLTGWLDNHGGGLAFGGAF
ncbi:MAG TPA: hypothetical protein VLB44_04925 [Kofleriaceae bacterium]|nr:hypothetical protein [Kofleriaceae bacterium]